VTLEQWIGLELLAEIPCVADCSVPKKFSVFSVL
jgi:hypothetical protein